MRKFLLIIALSVIGFFLSPQTDPAEGSSSPKLKPLKVSLITWPGCGPGYLALANKYFGELPVEFIIIDGTPERRAAFKSGKIDLLISTIDQYAIEYAIGLTGKIVMLTEISHGADGIVGYSPIKNISDLKNKKVAYAEGTASHFLLLNMLYKNKLSSKDIVPIVFDDPSKAGEAFISHSVDAAVTWEPFLSQALSQENTVNIANTKDLQGLIIGAFIASETTLAERNKDIKVFIDGWLKAVQDIMSKGEATYPVMAKGLSIPLEDFAGMTLGIEFVSSQEQKKMFANSNNKPSRVDIIFQDAARLWKDVNIIKSTPKVNSIVDDIFVKQ